MSDRIHIRANGRPVDVPVGLRLDDFIVDCGQSPKLVVVERNGTALTPAEARAAVLEDGDVLEIVRIVAGG